MPTTSITVASQIAAADSTAATVSEKVKADGYYGNSDGLHTVAYICSSDFVGTIKMQGSLATTPTEDDFFDIDGTTMTSDQSTKIASYWEGWGWCR